MPKGASKSLLTIDDISEKYQELAETIGIEALIKLSGYWGGAQHYIPHYDGLLKDSKNEGILFEYNGKNLKELASKYKCSESTVRRILKDKITEKKKAPLEGQMSLVI